MTVLLGLLDAAVGAFLIVYALRRERRDKAGVLFVGVILLLCACGLLWLSHPSRATPRRPLVPTPGALV